MLGEVLGGKVIKSNPPEIGILKIKMLNAKDNDKLSIIGGGLDGKTLSVDEVKQLASLPSLDELRGKLVGLIKSPSQKLASVAVAPANKLVNVLHAKANQ